MVFTSVMLRYLGSGALVWAEELSRYAMIWLAFVGIGPVLRVGGHVAVDSLTELLPPASRRALRLVVVALMAATCLWVAAAGWAYVARSWNQTTPVLGLPFAVVALAAPAGFVLALWHLAMVAVGFVRDGSYEPSDDLDPEKAAAS
nr:TRAP transporter small permease [Ancylobacter gelatini]